MIGQAHPPVQQFYRQVCMLTMLESIKMMGPQQQQPQIPLKQQHPKQQQLQQYQHQI